MLEYNNSSMDQMEVHVEVVVALEVVGVVGVSKAVVADISKRAVSELVVAEDALPEAGSAEMAAAGSKTAAGWKNAAGVKTRVGGSAQTVGEGHSSWTAQGLVGAVRSQLPSWRSPSIIARLAPLLFFDVFGRDFAYGDLQAAGTVKHAGEPPAFSISDTLSNQLLQQI